MCLSRRGEGSTKSHEDCRDNHRDQPSIWTLCSGSGARKTAELPVTLHPTRPCLDTHTAHATSDTAEWTVQSNKERKIRTLWTRALAPHCLSLHVQYFFPLALLLWSSFCRSLLSLCVSHSAKRHFLKWCIIWCVFSWNVGLCGITGPEALWLTFVSRFLFFPKKERTFLQFCLWRLE